MFNQMRSAVRFGVAGACVMALTVVSPGVGVGQEITASTVAVSESAWARVTIEQEPPGPPVGLSASYKKKKKRLTVSWFPAAGHGLPVIKYKYFARVAGSGKIYHQAEIPATEAGGTITHWASHKTMKRGLDIAVIAVSEAGDGEAAVTSARW